MVRFGKVQRWPLFCEGAWDVNLQLAIWLFRRSQRGPISDVTRGDNCLGNNVFAYTTPISPAEFPPALHAEELAQRIVELVRIQDLAEPVRPHHGGPTQGSRVVK